jgi:GTP:adenosylcobinamide-phosphate guanylyltransferase
MDALILAGGPAPPELCTATGCPDRALIPLLDQPMVARVLDALRATPGMEKIAVVGSAEALAAVSGVLPVQAGGRMVDNLQRGLAATSSESVIVCTCDIPLVTGATFEAFVRLATARHLELAYPIVRRAISEAAYPGGHRTYARLSDGEFTGGNAVIVPRRVIADVVELIDVAYNARKTRWRWRRFLAPLL